MYVHVVKFLQLQVKISVKEKSPRENKEIHIKIAYLKILLRITVKLLHMSSQTANEVM